MALNWSNSAKEAQINGIKALVYAPPGFGKTVMCSTNPNSLMLSAESGLLSLGQLAVPMPVLKITCMQDLNDAYAYLASKEGYDNFQGFNIDSISEIAEVILAAAKKEFKDPRQAYGEVIEKVLAATRFFRDLPGYNVLVCAKQEPMKDELTGSVKFGPSLPGQKLGNQLPYFFDEVFNLGIGKADDGSTFRYLLTQPDIQYVAKDRSGMLDTYEAPDFGAIIEKILSGVPA